jgi:hypothetical protein
LSHLEASGFGLLTYQWQRNGEVLPGETGSALTLTDVQFSQEGDYSVTVTDQFGSVQSSAARLLFKPQITQQPQPQSVNVGETVNFSITLTGSLPITYQWRHNGRTMDGWPQHLSEHTSTITIEDVEVSDAGTYDVIIRSDAPGQVPFLSDRVELTVTE